MNEGCYMHDEDYMQRCELLPESRREGLTTAGLSAQLIEKTSASSLRNSQTLNRLLR